jgi:hypothetical protein
MSTRTKVYCPIENLWTKYLPDNPGHVNTKCAQWIADALGPRRHFVRRLLSDGLVLVACIPRFSVTCVLALHI